MTEVLPYSSHRNTPVGRHTSRSRASIKNGTQSVLSKNSQSLGKVWLAFLQSELKTRLPSLEQWDGADASLV